MVLVTNAGARQMVHARGSSSDKKAGRCFKRPAGTHVATMMSAATTRESARPPIGGPATRAHALTRAWRHHRQRHDSTCIRQPSPCQGRCI